MKPAGQPEQANLEANNPKVVLCGVCALVLGIVEILPLGKNAVINRLFGSLPEVNYHLSHNPPKKQKIYTILPPKITVDRDKTIWTYKPWHYIRNIKNK